MTIPVLLQQIRLVLDGAMYLRKINLKRLSKHISGDVIEIGVGQGPDISFFTSLPQVTSYAGCDREEFHSDYSRGQLPPQVQLYKGSRIPFKDTSADTLISIDCIEHMPIDEIHKLYKEAQRVLKKDGKMIILAPFIYPEHCTPHDYYRYTRFGLNLLAEENNFIPVEVTARSSTFEALLVNLNHWLFFGLMPKAIVKEFGDIQKESLGVLLLKVLMLPFTISIYLCIVVIIFLSGILTQKREASPFSIGYSIVYKKKS